MGKERAKHILEIIVKFFFIAFILYFLWGIYLANLGYDAEMDHTIQAGLYEGEEKLEDVTIEVKGTFHNNFFQPDRYEGTFAVSCFPETVEDRASAHIGWSKAKYGENYAYIRFYRLRPDRSLDITARIDTEGNYTIDVLNREMTEIVWGTRDRYIATPAAYQAFLEKHQTVE